MTTVGYTSSRLAPSVARWNRSGTSSSACSSSCASSSSPRALRRRGDAGSSLSIGVAKSKQAVRRRGDVVSVRARVGTAFNKKNGNNGDDEDDEDDDARTSRRALLAGKVLFTVGEAFFFPWATEGATRPPSPGDADLAPFSPPWLRSILYSETDAEVKATAKAALLRGEALAAEGKHPEAIEAFETVYATAPREYKMCQRAGLDTSKSYKAMSTRLGDEMDKKGNEAKGTVWWWGRGTRWPGWYIIAYLSARSVFFTAKRDPVGKFTVTEGLFVLVPIWIGLLYALVEYGVPDY